MDGAGRGISSLCFLAGFLSSRVDAVQVTPAVGRLSRNASSLGMPGKGIGKAVPPSKVLRPTTALDTRSGGAGR
ncbi:hypothetical protein GQ53DRAFT_741878 [Thozetella sp. PMI_491]|nr:hypothetical protein GQ53DRAFT_741878 [Thozetella sp. PMI_491]